MCNVCGCTVCQNCWQVAGKCKCGPKAEKTKGKKVSHTHGSKKHSHAGGSKKHKH